ncbi:MAG: hypothetical protein AB7F40_04375 [Victivallaceae bacterium]
MPRGKTAKATVAAKASKSDSKPADQQPEPNAPDTGAWDAPETKPVVVHVLHFPDSGWCEKLGRSYFSGHYKCKNDEEYNALRRFADGEIRYDQR